MRNILETYKDLKSGIAPDKDMLLPMFGWFSASLKNIALSNDINEKFFYVNNKVLINKFMLNHTFMFLGKYPKAKKDDGKLKFYFDAVKKFFDWTDSELLKNLWDDSNEFRLDISNKFGFDNKQRRALGLKKIETKNIIMKKTVVGLSKVLKEMGK